MIYHLLLPLSEHIESFRVFDSVHLRALLAALTAFLIGIIVGPGIIERLGQLRWDRLGVDEERPHHQLGRYRSSSNGVTCDW